jgi:hypothetical protein
VYDCTCWDWLLSDSYCQGVVRCNTEYFVYLIPLVTVACIVVGIALYHYLIYLDKDDQ